MTKNANNTSKLFLTEKWCAETMENLLDDDDVPESDKKKLKEYKKKSKSINCSETVVSYEYTKNDTRRKEIGRMYAVAPSLQYFSKKLRNELLRDCVELDIENCHITLLAQVGKKYNCETKELEYFINNRNEAYLKLSENRDVAKTLYASAMYGGCVPELSEFSHEASEIIKKCMADKKNKDILKHATNRWNEKNDESKSLSATFSSFLLSTIENQIILCVLEFMNSQDEPDDKTLTPRVLLHDGIIMDRVYLSADELENIQQYVEDETGWSIKLQLKPVVSTYTPKIKPFIEIISDQQACNKIYELHKDDIIRTPDDWYVYIDGENHYCKGEEPLRTLIKKMNFKMKQANDTFKGYSSTSKGMKNIIDYLTSNCHDLFPVDENFITRVNRKTEGLTFFKDKYYNLATKSFHKITKDNLPIIYINRPAPCLDKITQTQMDDYKHEFLNMFSHDDLPNMLKLLSRGLAGHVKDKTWSAMMGLRNSGKGVFQGLVEYSFGEYCAIIELPMLQSNNSGDASAMRWILSSQCHLKRLCFTNEIKDIDGKAPLKLDGNAMKKCVSGGDKILCRALYKAEQPVVFNSLIIASVNQFPESRPSDAYMNIVPFKMPHKYVEEPVDICERKTDTNIKHKAQTDENRDIFMAIVFEAYTVNGLVEREWSMVTKHQYLEINAEKATEPIYIFKTNFQKAEDYFISTEDFKHVFREAKMSDKQLGMFLKQRLTPTKKQIDGKRMYGYTGVKPIVEIEDGFSSDSDNDI